MPKHILLPMNQDQCLDQRLLDIDNATIRTLLNQMHRVEIADSGVVQCLFQRPDAIVEDADRVPFRP